jgi:pimeloyl-ACP methyl ester carboxylesterase
MAAADDQTALVEERLARAGDEARESFWRGFGGALKKAAVATGRGTAWLARTGYRHRNYVPAVINGAIGDKLAEAGDRLAITMSFRAGGADVDPAELGELRGHVAVFVHGLMADDAYWTRPFGDGEGFGPVLARERGLTPLYVRYNSGLRIADNGRNLADLLDRLVQAHPGVDRLTLIGHSMGGLVVRSATHAGGDAGHQWPRAVDSVVLLGAPNDGAYLEQAAHLSAWVLDAVPTLTTSILAGVINVRSAGIKDLRTGIDAPLLPGVGYHVIAGTMTQTEDSIVAAYFGDGLVGSKSGLAARDSHGATSIQCRVFTRTAHLALVSSPEVQAFVSDALAVQALLDE